MATRKSTYTAAQVRQQLADSENETFVNDSGEKCRLKIIPFVN